MNDKTSPPSHKNGFLWSYFSPQEQAALENLPANDLTAERDLLFAGWGENFEQAASSPDHGLAEEELRTAMRVSAALGLLQRIQFKQRGAVSRWDPVLRQAYDLARRDLGIPDYLLLDSPPPVPDP